MCLSVFCCCFFKREVQRGKLLRTFLSQLVKGWKWEGIECLSKCMRTSSFWGEPICSVRGDEGTRSQHGLHLQDKLKKGSATKRDSALDLRHWGTVWAEGSEIKPIGNLDPPSEDNLSMAQKEIFWNLMNSSKELPVVRISAGPNHQAVPSGH